MAILVTGGLGFVGSHFVRAACDDQREVVVLDDGSGGEPAALPDGVAVVRADIADRELVARLVRERRIDAIAHFAGKIQVGESVRDPRLYFDVNLRRGLALLDAAVDAGVAAVLFSSTAAVYGIPDATPIPESAVTRPINPYGATKLGFEHALDAYGTAYGVRWAALRYFNAAGAHPDGTLREAHRPETHLIPLAIDAATGDAPPLTLFGDDYDTPDGTCLRDYVHVCDLASAHLRALDVLAGGETVGAANLGSGTGFSVREVIAAVEAAVGRRLPHTVGPRRPGDPARLVADPRLAAERLGWRTSRSDLATIVDDAARSRRGAR